MIFVTGAGGTVGSELIRQLQAKSIPFLGRKITHIGLSPDAYLQGMLASGMPAELAERMLDLERYIRKGRPGEVTGDIAAVTGRAPRSFGEFVQETAATGVWAAAMS